MERSFYGSSLLRTAAKVIALTAVAGSLACSGCGEPSNNENNGTNNQTEGAELTVAPISQDFGDVPVGETSEAATVTVTNEGPGTTGDITVTLDGADFAIATEDCSTLDLESAETCTVDVEYTPGAEGDSSGTLTVTAENWDGEATVSLSGAGAGAGEITISPTPHDFGTTAVGETSDTMEFTVTNDGGTETPEITATLSGGAATEFSVVDDGCSATTLAAEATCTISVEFAPQSAGAKSTSLSVVAGADLDATAALSGTAVEAPELSITPAAQNYGDVTVGNTSADATFTVTNDGGLATGDLTAALAGADAGEFNVVADTCTGSALDGGDTCTVSVNFAPSAEGAKTASLDVTASPGGSVSSALSGNAITGPGLSITPSPADFGTATVDTAGDTVTFTVENTGGSDAGALTTNFAGTNPGDFEFVSGANGCQGIGLAAGSTCTISVRFRPTAAGDRTAELRVSGNPGGSATATLNGVGEAVPQGAVLSINPTTGTFGSVDVGNTSTSVTFTVTNIGDEDSGVPSSTITGTNFSQFRRSANGCTATLAPTDSCDIEVVFEPTSEGDKTAVLQVDASPGNTVTADLQGVGQAPADLSANPTVLSYTTPVINGGQSNTQSVVITNDGTQASGVISTTIGTDFTIASDTCTGNTLAAGANCTITVRFTPQTVGVKAQSLTVTADPGAAAGITIGLNGESLPEFTIEPSDDPYDFGTWPVGTSTTQQFTITNNDGLGDRNRDITAAVTGTDFSASTNNCDGTTVTPSDSCTVTVEFAPTGSPGARTGTLDISDAGGATASTDLTGEASGPLQVLADTDATVGGDTAADPYDFGDVPVDTTQTIELYVYNRDNTNSGTLNVNFDGNMSFGIVADSCAGEDLTQDDTMDDSGTDQCVIEIIFYPSSTGSVTGTLNITSQSGLSASASVTGNGTTGAELVVTGDGAFGDIATTNTVDRTFTITNNGAATSDPVAETITGNGIFSIDANTCINTLNTLDPGQSCQVTVRAAPAVDALLGDKSADLHLGAQAADQELTATVIPQLVVTPSPATFPDTVEGETSDTVTLTVENIGSTDVTNPGVTTQDVDAGDLADADFGDVGADKEFTIDTNNCATVTAGDSCTILVVFEPNDDDTAEDGLLVDGGDDGNTVLTGLTGEGLTAANLAFDTDVFQHLGDTIVGQTGITRTYTLRNTGDEDSGTITTTKTGGGDFLGNHPGDFTVTDGCNGQNLAPSGFCTYEVTFEPTATGTRDIVFEATAPNDSNDPSITVTGDGLTDTDRLEITPGAYQFDNTVDGQESATQTFTVRNRSSVSTDGPIAISFDSGGAYFDLVGDTNDDDVLDDTDATDCDRILAANQTCTFEAFFAPTDTTNPAPEGLTAIVRATDSGATPTVTSGPTTLQGYRRTVAGLSISSTDTDNIVQAPALNPEDWNFRDTAVGDTRDGVFTISNSGGQDTGAIDSTLSGVSVGSYDIVNDGCAAGIGPDESCDLTIRFSPPSVTDDFQVTLDVDPTNGTGDSAVIQGDGVAAPSLEFDMASYDCGAEIPATTSIGCGTITVTNTGDLSSSPPSITLSNDTDFELQPGGCNTDTDGNGELDPILPGGANSCDITVTYNPQTVSDLHETDLTISATDGGSDTATVEGDSVPALHVNDGLNPATVQSDAEFDFTGVDVGSSDSVTIVVTNPLGADTSGFLSVSLTGTNSDEYSIVNAGGGTVYPYCAGQKLGPEDQCEVTVEFIPSSVATDKTATLTVTDGDAVHTIDVSLTGDGTNP